MKNIYRYSCGEGKLDFVMLHGWGLNSNVWCYIINRFGSHFRLHLFDIPGYGFSQSQESLTLSKISETVFKKRRHRQYD
ncbi:alpha/beta fold hydrolase [Candidatus Williamhamiltonella defendens]|uniref:alpha/beta fold hydrolase n=1 Tax=Candidatus Williamhamiltonella defendens TaxID=138072 RepID=UPI002A4E1EC8|nr:alpha/beta fold hydrolase [Candidatus Hamiltonella defensa]